MRAVRIPLLSVLVLMVGSAPPSGAAPPTTAPSPCDIKRAADEADIALQKAVNQAAQPTEERPRDTDGHRLTVQEIRDRVAEVDRRFGARESDLPKIKQRYAEAQRYLAQNQDKSRQGTLTPEEVRQAEYYQLRIPAWEQVIHYYDVTRPDALAKIKLIEAWANYERDKDKNQYRLRQTEQKRNDASRALVQAEKEVEKAIAAARADLDGADTRLKTPPADVMTAAKTRARADSGLQALWAKAKHDKNDPAYHQEAKRLVYNEVRRLERQHLLELADKLSQYDCFDNAKALINKILATSGGEKFKEQLGLAVDPGGLGTVALIPDDFAFPLDDNAPDQATANKPADKPVAGPVWVRQDPVIEAGANAKASGSGVVITSEKDGQKYTANVNWSEPKAELREGEEVTLTINAGGAMPGWALGWFNVNCAGGKYKVNDNNAASWPDGKRTGPQYNQGKLVFDFAPGSDAAINVQAGQEPGTSRWASVTWKYKRKE